MVDEAADRAAQALPGVRPRHASSSCTPEQPQGARLRPPATRTSASWWSPTCRASCSTSSSTSRAFKGMVPVELFGRTEFPPIGELPYLLTLGPHAFYWFALRAAAGATEPPSRAAERSAPPSLDRARRVGRRPARRRRERRSSGACRAFLPARRWFGGKALRDHAACASSSRCRSATAASRSPSSTFVAGRLRRRRPGDVRRCRSASPRGAAAAAAAQATPQARGRRAARARQGRRRRRRAVRRDARTRASPTALLDAIGAPPRRCAARRGELVADADERAARAARRAARRAAAGVGAARPSRATPRSSSATG